MSYFYQGDLEAIRITYFKKLSSPFIGIYQLILFLLSGTIICLPVIKVNTGISGAGMIRPAYGVSEIKVPAEGFIDSVFVHDGEYVSRGAVLYRMDGSLQEKRWRYLMQEKCRITGVLHDLGRSLDTHDIAHQPLVTGLLKSQQSFYSSKYKEWLLTIEKANREFDKTGQLYLQHIIPEQEYYGRKMEREKLLAGFNTFKAEKLMSLRQSSETYEKELMQVNLHLSEAGQQKKQLLIRAPVSGSVRQPVNVYNGRHMNTGEVFCTISPDTVLIAECFISNGDIDKVHKDGKVRFKIEAFQNNPCNILQGKILSIEDDYTLINEQPMYKVVCSIASDCNGSSTKIKKGMIFKAFFTGISHTLWEVLSGRVNYSF